MCVGGGSERDGKRQREVEEGEREKRAGERRVGKEIVTAREKDGEIEREEFE